MVPELGSFAIILALAFALIQLVAPLISRNAIYVKISQAAVLGQFIFIAFAMLCLIISFLRNDMTVLFVREHSHQLLPFIYRIGAAWGGHEGSLLLWCLILSGWSLAFTQFSSLKKLSVTQGSLNYFSKIVMVLGFISTGFILFLFSTSNPFQRNFPNGPIAGEDLTPILQDPGLIFHPPMLYLGYVGFAIGFAFAICALIEGKLQKEWASACRPWVILPWAFLGCGIVLGSWWAYRELGWGGWWFWDPVENASLLPWLAATALIHSLIVSEKREVFKGWTILLAIITFALSLLGTFLVRSGVLVSVHAFASDPTRGLFLLSYLGLIIGGALILYSLRINCFYQKSNFQLFSRETLLLINSVFMITAVGTIVLGTLYPIMLDALDLGKISVGEPYFNAVFIPIILPLLMLMGFAPHVHWGQQSFRRLWKKLHLNFLISLCIGFLFPLIFGIKFYWLTSIGICLSIWVAMGTLTYAFQLWHSQNKIGLQHWAMILSHLGIAVLALGIIINKSYSEERQIKIGPGETVMMSGYHFIFKNVEQTSGPNYNSVTAHFNVQKNNQAVGTLSSQQRIYLSHDQTLSKPDILVSLWRDLYLALGSELADGSWSVRIYYKPWVRWIWFGGFMLLLGGLLSIFNNFAKRVDHV